MIEHILFIVATVVAFGILAWSFSRIFRIINLLKKPYSIKNVGERLNRVFKVVFGQTKILRFPIVGFMHALVLWGFILILVGSAEMMLDGFLGTPFDHNPGNDRIFSFLGIGYSVLIAGGDIFAWIIAILIIAFLIRRNFMKIKRFTGKEMRHRDHKDASFALLLILLLMFSLIGMNASYLVNAGAEAKGIYPLSSLITDWIPVASAHTIELIMW